MQSNPRNQTKPKKYLPSFYQTKPNKETLETKQKNNLKLLPAENRGEISANFQSNFNQICNQTKKWKYAMEMVTLVIIVDNKSINYFIQFEATIWEKHSGDGTNSWKLWRWLKGSKFENPEEKYW